MKLDDMANGMSILRPAPAARNGDVEFAKDADLNRVKVNGHGEPRQAKYDVTDQPIGTIKPVRVIAIGAGASGINMAYQTKQFLKEVDLMVYEKNPDVGGTWFENRYPGCKCDIRE